MIRLLENETFKLFDPLFWVVICRILDELLLVSLPWPWGLHHCALKVDLLLRADPGPHSAWKNSPQQRRAPELGAGPSRAAQAVPRRVPELRQDSARLAGEGSFLASPALLLKQPQTGAEGLTWTVGRPRRGTRGAP